MKLNKVKSHWNERWVELKPPSPTKSHDYFVSDYGRIKSIDRRTEKETLLSGSATVKGFRQLNFRLKDGSRHSIYIHKFVATHFLEKKEDDEWVTHLDDDRNNNYYKNLKWINREELNARARVRDEKKTIEQRRTGRHVKMTESQVRLLKKRLKRGKTKRKILAKDFGISTMQLSRIERGENWGDIN